MGDDSVVTVYVAHRCTVIAAGLASILGRMPGCRVHSLRQSQAEGERPLDDVDGGILIADMASASSFIERRQLETTLRMPKLVVMSDSPGERGSARLGLPNGVDECLPVECHEGELLASIHRLTGIPNVNRCRTLRGGLAPAALCKVKRAMESRMAEACDLRLLARLVGLSEGHFARAFKQSVGVPPHRYLLKLRVEAAADLIRSSDRSLTDVSLEVGFSDQSHFTRTFSREMGETPSAYRFRHR
ncbi:AraC family transcriptional regulator [Roseateles agri]|nr:AraC family transcriptional regulator [Paucibacter sp. R3-3]